MSDLTEAELVELGRCAQEHTAGTIVTQRQLGVLIAAARELNRLKSALEHLREHERVQVVEWYRQPGEREYDATPERILALAKARGWKGNE